MSIQLDPSQAMPNQRFIPSVQMTQSVLARPWDRSGSTGQTPIPRVLVLGALLVPLLTLTACMEEGDQGVATGTPASQVGAGAGQAGAPAQTRSGPDPAPIPLATAPAGFTALPSPQQVLAPLAGKVRPDPFAPLNSSNTSGLTGLVFRGVISSRGQSKAFVDIATDSAQGPGSAATSRATLCVGPRGLCPGQAPQMAPLPPSWRVTGIDSRQGTLSMVQGTTFITCRLGKSSLNPGYGLLAMANSCSGLGDQTANAAAGDNGTANSPQAAGQNTPAPGAGTSGSAPASASSPSGTGTTR